jgi:1-acyl-sn-glycerol-3-phosphate acyltransferase
MPPQLPDMPLVVYCNHPSWWDPLLCLWLARHFFPTRTHYGPIEATALERYRLFTRLGFFGIAMGTRRGAATFLRLGEAILRQPATALWVTPEGQFTDPRLRPVRLQPGLGHLARRLARGVFLPLAFEYPFWEERFPEVLVCFGEPVAVVPVPQRRAAEWTALLARRLEAAQDGLAQAACQRDHSAFEMLLRGRAGVGGVYDVWRAMRARLRGAAFQKAHGREDV